jgi:hypothetical protein
MTKWKIFGADKCRGAKPMGNSDAAVSLEKPISADISQGNSFNAGKSQGELVQINVEEQSPSEAFSAMMSDVDALNAGTSQEDLVKINVEEPSPSAGFECETNGSKCPLPSLCHVT